jgi:enoyl-CoA hydratase/carnithine racemase
VTAGPVPSYHPDIRVEQEGHVATVTIDRPASRNGCTGDMWVALGRSLQAGPRCIVLTGAGGNFCTGADLGGPQEGDPPSLAPPGANNMDGMRVLADVVLAIHDCPVPVVAKVDGLCVGAGFGLALAADLTWCADRARFSAIFAKRGLSLDFGTSWLLRQRIGVHKAKELAYTAKMMSGAEALEVGFVNAVVPADELDAAVQEVVDTIAAGPPIALSMTKRELDGAATSSLAQALEVEALAQTVNVHTEDLKESLLAFVERRPAVFVGR